MIELNKIHITSFLVVVLVLVGKTLMGALLLMAVFFAD